MLSAHNVKKRTRPSFATVLLTIISVSGVGCTQMPQQAPPARLSGGWTPTLARSSGARVDSAWQDARRPESGGARSRGRGGDGRARDDRPRPAAAEPAALAVGPGKGREQVRSRESGYGILHVSQMFRRGPRARKERRNEQLGTGGRIPLVTARQRGPARGTGLSRGRSSEAASSGERSSGRPHASDNSLVDLEPGTRASAVGRADLPGSSPSRPRSDTSKRVVVRGGRSGDDVSEMTRFVRPEEPRSTGPGRLPLRSSAMDFGNVFTDFSRAPEPEPFNPFRSWSRCGHGRF